MKTWSRLLHKRHSTLTALSVAFILLSTARALSAQQATESSDISIVEELSAVAAFRLQSNPAGQFDPDHQVFRIYHGRSQSVDLLSGSVEETDRAVRSYLKESEDLFRVGDPDKTLRLERVRISPGGTHISYRQVLDGIPVFERNIKVNLNRSGRPTMIFNGLDTELLSDESPRPVTRATITSDEARYLAQQALSDRGGRTLDPELVILPLEWPRLAWSVIVLPSAGGEFRVLVGAHSGEALLAREETLHRGHSRKNTDISRDGLRRDAASPQFVAGRASMVNGSGYVFDPDPLATAGKEYAPPYVDADDADTPELNAERKLISLADITQGNDGLYRLIGPHIEIVSRRPSGQENYEPPAEQSADGFRYTRGDERFEAVTVYYHVDKSQRYVQSLGFNDTQNAPLPTNPFGEANEDVSNYYVNLNFLAFGGGGVDDGEDAFVIWHEYGHALLNSSAPGITGSFEGRALHEAWSDYWAASYQRHLFEADSLPAGDWKRFFRWDGNNSAINWFGRTLTPQGVYPADMNRSSIYLAGLLWVDAMMEVYDMFGREVTDQLNLQSHFYLGPPVTLASAARAVIQADIDLFDAAHASELVAILGRRGLVDSSEFVPSISHQAIGDTEQMGGTATFEISASSLLYELSRTEIFLTVGDGAPQRIPMSAAGDDVYTASVGLPGEPSIVSYYIEVEDAAGQLTRLPERAPTEQFQFQVGPDTQPPSIVHNAITTISLSGWPPPVVATVTDNIGVDTVWVEYEVTDDLSGAIDSGSFGLGRTGDTFVGHFPTLEGLVDGNEEVRYRIRALDRSTSKNETTIPPASGQSLSFRIVESGLLAAFDFESAIADVSATGIWERGAPSFGQRIAHSGNSVWFTSLDGPYSAGVDRAMLTLPAIDLSSFESAYLEFWHWYDIEHDGTSDPGSTGDAVLWDGGNVTISLDGGNTWTVATPVDGYDGTIADGAGNPKAGEPAFGGYSFGWRRAIVPLSGGGSVLVRFDFGSDVSNEEPSLAYAGWAIDDVSIRTDRILDVETPEIVGPPRPLLLEAVVDGKPNLPRVRLSAIDNTGVESVRLDFDTITSSGTATGVVRLAMSPDDLSRFEAVVPIDTNRVGAGDRVEYRLRVQDFDGNTTVYPAAGAPPLAIEFQTVLAINTLSGARPSGGWIPANAAWLLENPTGGSASLVLSPVDLAENASTAVLEIEHDYRFGNGAGGNAKVSQDGGQTWSVVEPESGYTGMIGSQAAFVGTAIGTTSEFDLLAFKAKQVRFRLDFNRGESDGSSFWKIVRAEVRQSSATDEFDIPRELAVHPNFPNPFAESTTISYTLPTDGYASLVVYDVTGRRVGVLVEGNQPAGTYTTTLDGSQLSAGVYLARLVSDGKETIRRLVRAG